MRHRIKPGTLVKIRSTCYLRRRHDYYIPNVKWSPPEARITRDDIAIAVAIHKSNIAAYDVLVLHHAGIGWVFDQILDAI